MTTKYLHNIKACHNYNSSKHTTGRSIIEQKLLNTVDMMIPVSYILLTHVNKIISENISHI